MSSDQQNATSFGLEAPAYERGRPGYPKQAIDWMIPEPGQRVLDLGAGTGKLTRILVEAGHMVTAVDPDPAMLVVLRTNLPDVPALVGSAESIPAPDQSADAVTFGQAWHWVEPVAASREAGRVLRTGGVLGLIWNIRDESVSWVSAMTDIMSSSKAERMISAGGPTVAAPFEVIEEQRFTWTRPMTKLALLDMARSRSYLITAEADTRARIESELGELLDGLPNLDDGGSIELPYVTTAYRTVRL